MDAVSDNPLDMNLVPSMKRKKGKKKDAAAGACQGERGWHGREKKLVLKLATGACVLQRCRHSCCAELSVVSDVRQLG